MADPITRLIDRLNKVFTDRSFHRSLGNKAKDIIFKRTKSGFGVDSDISRAPRRKKLKTLSPDYVKFRSTVKLGRFGSPKRSNLTLTGQLLDSLSIRVTRNGFQVRVPSSRRRGVRGRVDRNTNNDILQFTRAQRPFLALTVPEQRIITREIRDAINKQLNITLREEI